MYVCVWSRFYPKNMYMYEGANEWMNEGMKYTLNKKWEEYLNVLLLRYLRFPDLPIRIKYTYQI